MRCWDSRLKRIWRGTYSKFSVTMRMNLAKTTASQTTHLVRILIGELDDVLLRSDGAVIVGHRNVPTDGLMRKTTSGPPSPAGMWAAVVITVDAAQKSASVQINGLGTTQAAAPQLVAGDIQLLMGPQEPSSRVAADWRVLFDDVVVRGTK